MTNFVILKNRTNNAIYIGKYTENITPKKVVNKLEKRFGRLNIFCDTKDIKKLDAFEKTKFLNLSFEAYQKETDSVYLNSLKKSLELKNQDNDTKSISIKISTLTGKHIDLICKENLTIPEIKLMILEKEGIPMDQQRIVFAGKQYDNDDNLGLNDLKIMNEAKFHLVLRLRGGMFTQTTSGQIDYKNIHKMKVDFDFDAEDDSENGEED
jgi:hypothetical protein